MDSDDTKPIEPIDLAGILVLEAGRILENAAPRFALALPDGPARAAHIAALLNAAEVIRSLLSAAAAHSAHLGAELNERTD